MMDVVIIGAGIHAFGRFDKTAEEIGSHAARMALADAGLAWSDIQASYLSRMYLPASSGARILRQLGGTDMPIVAIEAACASGGAALRPGVLAIRSGECDVVLVLGAGTMPPGLMAPRQL